jgi:hypothetical protein
MAKSGKEKIDFHVHPHFENYTAKDVVDAMYKKDIGIVGLAGYNEDIFDSVRREFDKLEEPFKVASDSLAIKIRDEQNREKYILRITEYENKEGFHLLVFGNPKKIKPQNEVRKNIEAALSTDSFAVLDHPFVASNYSDIGREKEDFLFKLCKEYSNRIALEWNGYCIPFLRNSIDKLACLPLRLFMGKETRFGDVNKKLEAFEETLKENSINCPVIADSDLHARKKNDLCFIGTANIETFIEKRSGKALQQSLKKRIFSLEYNIKKGYVSITHFLLSYAFPVAISQISNDLKEKIRARG